MERRFVFVLGSTRPESNSEQLARLVARELAAGSEQRWVRLIDHPLAPFADTRHSVGYAAPEGNA